MQEERLKMHQGNPPMWLQFLFLQGSALTNHIQIVTESNRHGKINLKIPQQYIEFMFFIIKIKIIFL